MSQPQTTFLATWREPGKVAIDAAWQARGGSKDLLSCVEKGLIAAEEDISLIAIGKASLPNADGVVELDASIMEGKHLKAGAVCAVKDISPVISLARLVMEKTPHVMLAGDEARRFGIENGFKPTDLSGKVAMEQYRVWKENRMPEFQAKDYVHVAEELGVQHIGDTVTVLGREVENGIPHFVSASSTSGLSWKIPGRVGDSPIIGAGTYADDEIGCAGATGLGEELWKAVASFRVVEAMRQGKTAQQACDEVVAHMVRRQPGSTEMACVVLAIGKDGNYGAATTAGTFTLWICRDGVISSQDFVGISN